MTKFNLLQQSSLLAQYQINIIFLDLNNFAFTKLTGFVGYFNRRFYEGFIGRLLV